MATSGSGTLYPNNGSFDCPVEYSWTRDANGVVTWKAQIFAIGGGHGIDDSSPCWTTFYIRGGNGSKGDLTGNLAEYCSSCSQCAAGYQGNILWQHNDYRGGALTGTINMGTGGGTLYLGYYGQRNGSNTSEDYLSWSVDPAVSPPTGLNVTNITAGQDSFTATVSISGWGVGSGTRYRELQVWTNGMVEPKRYQTANGDSLSSSITCTNGSSGSLTIIPNAIYTIGGYATNGAASVGSTSFGNATTLLPTPSVAFDSATTDSLTITLSVPNQGGARTMTPKYNMDNQGWVNLSNMTGSGSKSVTFVATGLLPNSSHSVTPRLSASGTSDQDGTTLTGLVTKPPVISGTFVSSTKDSLTMSYSIPNQGGAQTMTVQYSLDGTTWVTCATVAESETKTGQYTISNLVPNTSYTVRTRLVTTAGTTTGGTISSNITKSPDSILEPSSISSRRITINYMVNDQGGAKTLYLEYQLDGGSWTTVKTITTSGAVYGSFTLDDLAPMSTHTITCRVRNASGDITVGNTMDFTLHDVYAKGYCSVNNTRMRISKWYCSVNNTRKRVIKVYGSVNGQRKLVWEEP